MISIPCMGRNRGLTEVNLGCQVGQMAEKSVICTDRSLGGLIHYKFEILDSYVCIAKILLGKK